MEDRRMRVSPLDRQLKWQAGALCLMVVLAAIGASVSTALAVAFGGSIALAAALWQRRGLIRATHHAKSDASANLLSAYRCEVERWCLVIALFTIGLLGLSLQPLALLLGFFGTQVAVLLGVFDRTKN